MELMELMDNEYMPRPFPCTWKDCHKRFNRKSDLQRHVRTHTNERPYICNYAGCDKKFVQRSALTVHYRTHTGEKPHHCHYPACDKKFSDSSSLARHRRIHTGKRPYQCSRNGCEKSFCRKSTMVKHQKKTHRRGVRCTDTPDELVATPDSMESIVPVSQPSMTWARAIASVPVSTEAPVSQAISSGLLPARDSSTSGGGSVHHAIVKPDPYPSDSQILHSGSECQERQMTHQQSSESHHSNYLMQHGGPVMTLMSNTPTTLSEIPRNAPQDGLLTGRAHSEVHAGAFVHQQSKILNSSEDKMQIAGHQNTQQAAVSATGRLASSNPIAEQHHTMRYPQGQTQSQRLLQNPFYLPSQSSAGLMLAEGFRDSWQRPEPGVWCGYPQSPGTAMFGNLPSTAFYDFRMESKADQPNWCFRFPQTQISGS